jgi:hypothetical protein
MSAGLFTSHPLALFLTFSLQLRPRCGLNAAQGSHPDVQRRVDHTSPEDSRSSRLGTVPRVGPDLRELIRGGGLDSVSWDLVGWLAEASELGSGDDVTVRLSARKG